MSSTFECISEKKTIGEFTLTHFQGGVSVTKNSPANILSLTLLSHVLLKNTTGNVLLLDVVIETQIVMNEVS